MTEHSDALKLMKTGAFDNQLSSHGANYFRMDRLGNTFFMYQKSSFMKI